MDETDGIVLQAGPDDHCYILAVDHYRERLGVDDIALILQQNRLRWYGHVLRKDDDDWAKKCMEYGKDQRGPGKR